MAIKRCAPNPLQAEFSLCGDAYDAYDTGDADEPYEFAQPGQSITCPECCNVIREVREIKNQLRPRKE